MPLPRFLVRFAFLLLLLGTNVGWLAAQVDLPPLRTSGSSSRPALEPPPSYEPARSPGSSLSTRSSRGTSKIPDPVIFDGSDYPEEERPEQAMIAQFEQPGGEPQPSSKDEPGPGQQNGGGGQGPGGDGGPPGGGGGQMAGTQIPGLPPIMGGGGGEGEEGEGEPGQSGSGTPPPIAESQMGDQSGSGEGGQEGEPGQPGAPGAPEAPQVAGQEGRQLEKPSEIQIGDEGAKLAEADVPQADASKQLENAPGEDRMSVKAASGNQTSNRGKGTERGVDIPSNL